MRLGKIKAWKIKYGNRIGFSRGRYVRVGNYIGESLLVTCLLKREHEKAAPFS